MNGKNTISGILKYCIFIVLAFIILVIKKILQMLKAIGVRRLSWYSKKVKIVSFPLKKV